MTILHKEHANDLLSAFIHNYNNDQEASEQTQQALEDLNVAFHLQSQESDTLKQQIKQQQNDLHLASKGLVDAEKIARAAITQKNEINLLRSQLTSAQQEITTLNNANPKRLKTQVDRLKAKSEEKDKKISQLTIKLSDTKHKLKKADADKEACKKIVELQRIEIDNNKAQGLYHNGDHHLVIWPQTNTMQRPDGSEFEGTNLLYLHQSGRGGFITFDPQADESKLCPTPKGGLRPSAQTLEFAHNWLYKVNQVQQGKVKDDDRTPINYNHSS